MCLLLKDYEQLYELYVIHTLAYITANLQLL
jgi:hypothetical protein